MNGLIDSLNGTREGLVGLIYLPPERTFERRLMLSDHLLFHLSRRAEERQTHWVDRRTAVWVLAAGMVKSISVPDPSPVRISGSPLPILESV